jgi:hypothetical protein
VESYITSVTAAYKELINPQISDSIKNLGLEDDDGILKKLTDLLDVLNKNIDGKYSNDQVKQIYSQANIILADIDKILGPYDDIREERDRLLAAKRGDDTLEGIAEYTKDVGNALRLNTPSKVASSSATANMPPPVNAFAKPRERLFPSSASVDVPPPPANIVSKPREKLFPSSTPAVKPPYPPVKSDIIPPVNAASSSSHDNVTLSEHAPGKNSHHYKVSTEAADIRTREELALRHKIEVEHQAKNKIIRPVYTPTKHLGGKSTKKKSRKSSHNKRHTKRAMPGKPQTKTRNKRTKRGRNKTHKK